LPHPTQKPLELLRRVILTSTKEGDLILDPLAGTGTTGFAAKMLGRDFVLIEKNPQYVQLIRERLSQSLLK
ncbi:DNA methyltransferase, partial [Thermocrinis sp.]|uniref:DNA methyltransferase n=1 Tax=Thermocrinis sp. TaxID=2024383 RepID=UPI003BFC807C